MIERTLDHSIQRATEHATKRLRVEAETDPLTGLGNRRALDAALGDCFGSGVNAESTVALLVIDMDHFKRIVDTYGHPSGGKVLREVAEVIGRQLNAADSLVRYGGDEYVILLPCQGKEAALDKVERIRKALESSRFLVDDGHDVAVTASFGIAHYPDDASGLEELLRSADTSLYHSKGRGKNTITVS